MRFLIFAALLISSRCFAVEGFSTFTNPTPTVIANAVDSVFFLNVLNGKSSELGTAFMVGSEVGLNSTKVYFLTTTHSLKSVCSKPGPCPNLFLHQNPVIELNSADKKFSFQTKDLSLHNFEIVKVSQNPDLVLVRTIIPSYQARTLKALRISKSCEVAPGDKLYAIGFPGAYLRTHVAAFPIEVPNVIIKRWSEGILVEESNFKVEKSPGLNDLFATSIDSLDGNSGGPILNEQGEVVGVEKASRATPKNQYKYTGQEKPGSMDWSSLAVPCKYLS